MNGTANHDPNSQRQRGTRGKIDDIDTAEISTDERIALRELRRYNPDFQDYNLYDVIPSYGGGTLICAEIFQNDDGKRERHEWQVLVRDGKAKVYTDCNETLRQGSEIGDWVTKATAPSTVLAVLTLIIVCAFIAFSLKNPPGAPDSLGVALSTVLGYWFGRLSTAGTDKQ